jgi:alpha-L-rhamnosidase
MRSLLIIAMLISSGSYSQKLQVLKLSCETAESPLGIENLHPVLGWQLFSSQRSVIQIAYRILVADDPVLLNSETGNIWDSKKIRSEQSLNVSYKGKKLVPAKTYYWKVMVWDNKGQSCWSSITSWQMGLLKPEDWKDAKWIGYESMPDSLLLIPAQHQKGPPKWAGVKDILPLFRTTINILKPTKRATAFICGLGHFELSVNGKKVSDHFLDPGWTKYDKEAQYVAFDITADIQPGNNAIGIMLGNGFYFIPGERYRKLSGAFGYPTLITRLFIEYEDGSSQDFVSNEQWKTSPSPVTFSSIYGGEDYDATLEQDGWNSTSFNDKQWENAIVVKGSPTLYHQLNPPLKVHETFSPKTSHKLKDWVYVFDLGQNASAIPQISVRGRRGDTIRIIPGELLKEDGSVSQRATGSPVYFQYILKGEGTETWQPRFSYYGFRYVQVEGGVVENGSDTIKKPVLIQVKGLHVRNAASTVGLFTSSSQLFNRIYLLIDWAVKSNMASVLTDCPHREKLGWLEQTHLMGNSIHYNYDVSGVFKKTIRDMQAAQGEGLLIPEYVPEYVKMPFMEGIFTDSPEWGSASIILPWYLYKWYGDRFLLEKTYSMMQRYLKHMQGRATGHILSYGLSDWYDVGPNRPGLSQLTPIGLTGTAIYYYDLNILENIARLLHKDKDARKYKKLAAQVKIAFNKSFFNKAAGQYGTGSQTANAMAVYMRLVPDAYKTMVVENIIKDLRERNYRITAGDVGFRYLLKVLQNEGHSDVIYAMNSRTDVPGYGYQLEKGATALTESWQALSVVSNNHLMLGHLMEWFYSGLGGVRQSESSIAYKEIEIDPQPVGDVHSVTTSYESPYGAIQLSWIKTDNNFQLTLSVPANTTAFVYLPTTEAIRVREGNILLDQSRDISVVGVNNGKLKLKIGSGTYNFSIINK